MTEGRLYSATVQCCGPVRLRTYPTIAPATHPCFATSSKCDAIFITTGRKALDIGLSGSGVVLADASKVRKSSIGKPVVFEMQYPAWRPRAMTTIGSDAHVEAKHSNVDSADELNQ